MSVGACLQNVRLVDVEKRHAESSSGFYSPTRKQRTGLRLGNQVKLAFESVGERLWLKVDSVLPDGRYTGSITSRPITTTLKQGDRVVFGPENIEDIIAI
jgi:hypothetical protein